MHTYLTQWAFPLLTTLSHHVPTVPTTLYGVKHYGNSRQVFSQVFNFIDIKNYPHERIFEKFIFFSAQILLIYEVAFSPQILSPESQFGILANDLIDLQPKHIKYQSGMEWEILKNSMKIKLDNTAFR